jgi:tape measure domain-containing protein
MAENEFYRLGLAVNITGDEQVKGKLRAMDNFIAHTKKQGEALNRMKASPAIHLTDRFTGAAQRVEQHMQRLHGVADALDRMKIAPLLSIRDNLTSGIMKADQVVKSLDMEQASPVITARDKVSSVVSRINAALEEIDKGHFSAAVEMRGDIINEAVQAKAALAKLDKTKAGPVADLKGELFGQLTRAMTEIRHLDLTTADPKASLRDLVTWKAREIGSTLRGLTSRAWAVTIQAKDQVTNVVKRVVSTVTSPIALLGAGAGLGAGLVFPLKLAGEMEQASIAMEFFTGSAEKGQAFLERLQAFAAKTPFEFPDVRQAAIGLMPLYKNVYGVNKAMDESIRTITAFGDAAGFTGAGINGMNLALLGFRQIGTMGKLSMEELRQVTENLLIPMDMITKELGITGEQLQDLGKLNISSSVAMEAIVRALEKNFSGGMEKMSQSLIGLTSTIKDTARLTVTAFGSGMAAPVKRILLDITGLTDYTGEKYKAFAKKLEDAGRRIGEAFERTYGKAKRFFDELSKNEAFQKMNWGDKVVYVLDQMMAAMSSWVSGSGGKQAEKVFIKLAEIGTRAWLTTLGGMVKGAGESLLHGNILGGIGLIAGAGLLGGGMLARGAWGLGKGALGLGRRIMGRGAVAGAGVAAETAATTEMATKGLNLGQVLREWFVTPASKRALEPIKQTVIPGTAETAARTVGGGWAPLRYIGKFGKVGNIISRAAIPLTLAAGAAEVAIARPEERVQTGLKVGGRIAGGLAGASLGAKAGAATGTLVAPGVGTLIGGAIGGLGGGIAGAIGGESVVKKISDLAKQVNFDALIDKTTKSFISLSEQVTQSWDKLKVNTLGKLTIIHDTVSGRIHEIVERAATEFSHLPENIGFVVGFTASKLVQLPGLIANLPEQIESYFSQIYTLSLQWAEQTVNSIITWFTNLPEQISTCWEQMVNSATIWGQQLYTSAITWVIQTVQGIFSWWSALPEQVSNWWAGVWSVVDTWASNTYSSVINWFSGIPGVIEKYISSTIDKITGLASLAWETIKGLGGRVTGGYKAGYEAARPHAQGGILTSPHLGLVAEAGPEAIIPLSAERRNQAFALWQQTGQMLGVLPHADGGIFGNILGGTKKAWNTTEKIFSTEKVSDIGNTVENVAIALESSRKGQEVTVKSIYKNYESKLKKAATFSEAEKVRGIAHQSKNLARRFEVVTKTFSRVALPLSLFVSAVEILGTSDKKQAIVKEIGSILGAAGAGALVGAGTGALVGAGVLSPVTAMLGAAIGAGAGAFGGQAVAESLYKRIAKYDTGGILTRPHLGMIAENGPEAIIPLSPGKRGRARKLYQQVGQELGVKQYAVGGIAGAGSSGDINVKVSTHFPDISILDWLNTNIYKPIQSVVDRVKSWGQTLIENIVGGMELSSINLSAEVTKLTRLVETKFKQGMGIASPSKVAFDIGRNTMLGLVNGMDNVDVQNYIKERMDTLVGSMGEGKSNVTGWLTRALSITKAPLSWLPGLQRLVGAESGGNPGAINPIAVGREHATGLLQTLPSTFRAYAVKGMRDILNPVHNAAAAINYIKSRYGSVYNTPLFKSRGKYFGYAQGGIVTDPHLGLMAEAGPEVVIPLSSRIRSRALELWQQAGEYLGVKPYAEGGLIGPVPAIAGYVGGTAGKGNLNVTVAGITVNVAGEEIDEEALALRIGRHIVGEIKKSFQNRA